MVSGGAPDLARRTRLAIVGASARAAALSALRAGFDVVTADLFADADLTARCPATRIENYPDGLADWLTEQDVDAWMYTGALENYPDLVDRMAAMKPLWGNRGAALRRCRDPFLLQTELPGAGLAFPETRERAYGLPLDGSWLCKTYRASSGAGVWLLDGEAALVKARERGAVYQKRVAGTPASAVYLLHGNASRFAGWSEQLVGRKWLGSPAWSYGGSIARPGWRSPKDLHSGVVAALAHGLGLSGVVGLDLVIADDRLWVIEVNPRFPASAEMAEASHFGNVVAGHAVSYGWRLPSAETQRPRRIAGKAILYAKRPAEVSSDFNAWAMSQANAGRLADIPHAGTLMGVGEPVLTLLEHGDPTGAEERLRARAAEVESRLH